MPALRVPRPVHARRLTAAALIALALMPLAMALANRSAALAITVAAALALIAAALEKDARPADALRALARSPLALAVAAFAAYAALSIAWSAFPKTSLFAYGEALLPVVAAGLAAVLLPRRVPSGVLRLAAGIYVAACAIVVVDLLSGLAVRHALGLRAETFIFNRPAITLLVLAWPLVLLWWEAGQARWALLTAAALAVVLATADSGAAVLGALAGAGAFAVAMLSRRLAIVLVTGGLLVCLAFAPLKGTLTMQLPAPVVAMLQSGHARERIAVWSSFEEAVWRRPLFGSGFGSSPRLGDDAIAREVPAERREMLSVGHPHDAFLQIWVELGAAGAAIAALVVVALMRALAHLRGVRLAASLALLASAAGIMLVGHGAWQGWWIAAVGAAVVWFGRRPQLGGASSKVGDG